MRHEPGRYVVALTLKNNKEALGESRFNALKRLKSLFYKFEKNPDLESQYRKVLDEYLTVGHMTQVTDYINENVCYLPHHAVIYMGHSILD